LLHSGILQVFWIRYFMPAKLLKELVPFSPSCFLDWPVTIFR